MATRGLQRLEKAEAASLDHDALIQQPLRADEAAKDEREHEPRVLRVVPGAC